MTANRTTAGDDELSRLQAQVFSSPLPMVAFRPDGYVLFANDHALAVVGLRREDDPQQTAFEFLNDPAELTELITRTRAGLCEPHELRMRKADGAPIHVLVSSEMTVAGGEELVMLGLQDVTTLRQAEEALRASEQRFRALVQNMADAISVLDPQGVILYNSPAAVRIFGVAEDEAVGTQSLDYVHPDDREVVSRVGAAMLANPGAVERYECRVRHKDGHYLVVEAVVSNLIEDPAIAGLVVNYRDVTERVNAREALDASERRFRALTDHSPDVILVIGSDGTVHFAGASVRDVLGLESEELVGRSQPWEIVHPEDLARVREIFQSVFDERGARARCLCRARHKDGRWISIDAILTNLIGDEAVGGVVINLRDVTELNEANEGRRLSEESFRTMADASTLGMSVFLRGRIAYANVAYARIFGYEVDEVTGLFREQMTDLIHPVDRELALARNAARLRGEEQPSTVEYRALRKDGESIWIEAEVSRFYFEGEMGLLTVLRDVTRRKETGVMLRRLSSVVEQTADAVIVTDVNGTIEYTNPATASVTGYSAAEMVGQNPRMLSSGEMPAKFYKRLWDTILAGRVFSGEFVNRRKDGAKYFEDKVVTPVRSNTGEIVQFISIGRDVTERKQAEETIRHIAYHDALTGLPNRALFSDRASVGIAQAKRAGGKLAVLFLDLDRLKNVNDTLGHDKGDEVIREVGLDVWNVIRDGDTVARMGGDEYAILVTGLEGTAAAEAVAGRIVEAVGRPRKLHGQNITVTASVGIAIYPDDGTDAGTLLRSADLAMYRAKEGGGGAYHMYSHLMGVHARERMEIENELRAAIEQGQLELYYQPQVSFASGEIVGVEALIRWNHPERGMIYPGDFIPVAEDTGLIVSLQFFVLSTAVRQMATWEADGVGELGMAINLSARCLRDETMPGKVIAALSETGVPARRLQFEITESSAINQIALAVETANSLKAIGSTIALDDFGMGYSSFSHLRRLPVDVVKLDMSIVKDVENDRGAAAIASSVITLAHELGMKVIAEGVETQGQFDALRQRGCDEYQGFLFSKALPADEVTALLRHGKAGPAKPRRRQRS